MLSVLPNEVGTLAGRISAHGLHKLLPPTQCITLNNFSKHETLNYKPLGLNHVKTL